MLQVDGRQGRGKLPQVTSGRADQRAQLSETPMSGCNLLIASRHHQGKPSRIVPVRFHPKARLFNRPRLRAFRPARHRLMEVRKDQKASVIESRKPLRGYAANPRTHPRRSHWKQGDRFGTRSPCSKCRGDQGEVRSPVRKAPFEERVCTSACRYFERGGDPRKRGRPERPLGSDYLCIKKIRLGSAKRA